MRRINALLLCAVAVIAVSCNGNLGDRRSNKVFFRVSMSDTRGAAITTTSLENTLGKFVVNGYLEEANRGDGWNSEADKDKPRFMVDKEFTYADSKWSGPADCFWRYEVWTNFWCYAPATMTYGTRTITPCCSPEGTCTDAQQKAMSFTYTMPNPSDPADGKDAEKLEDMIFAYARQKYTGSNNTVDITFSHALSAIQFMKGEFLDGYTIKSIKIFGFDSKGTCSMAGADNKITYTWGSYETPATGYKQASETESDLLVTSAGAVGTGSNIFIVIPQTLDSDVKVAVEISNGTTTDTKVASLGGSEVTWAPGKYYTYRLNYTDPSSSLDATLQDFNGTDWTTHDTGSSAPGTFTGDNW